MILRGPGIFRMVNEHWLQLKSPAAVTSNKRVQLFFEALKSGTNLSSHESHSTFFQCKAVSSTLKLPVSVI